jgi:hypothetical protein
MTMTARRVRATWNEGSSAPSPEFLAGLGRLVLASRRLSAMLADPSIPDGAWKTRSAAMVDFSERILDAATERPANTLRVTSPDGSFVAVDAVQLEGLRDRILRHCSAAIALGAVPLDGEARPSAS